MLVFTIALFSFCFWPVLGLLWRTHASEGHMGSLGVRLRTCYLLGVLVIRRSVLRAGLE
eukprot:CAMPEP_0181487306 /NCGR_PEP_ID=MMETSP1110-20121109/47734_1 /TAXON_ID=174948 /ORGANISM="Symbiodinium sp., Strain CCMP421" /LENGTH=58 /DNA_ID=CAMNT_0023613775 /DNA_START=9 /DNA_END=182 /DNA_ORIENTATION=-